MARKKAISLATVIDSYMDDCKIQGVSSATIAGYRRSLRCFMRWAEHEKISRITDFDAPLVKRYIAFLQDKHKWADNDYVPTQVEKFSQATVRNYVRDLKAFASWLVREEYTTDNVLVRVRKPKADEIPVDPFSQEEIDAIFTALDVTDTFGFRDYVLLHTLWDTGMRCGELTDLTIGDVNLKDCEIRVDHAKWGKYRDIGFGKQTQKYLSRYLAIGRPDPIRGDDTHFFLSVDGYPLTVNAIDRVCRRLSQKVGFRVHPHRFRHTFAVNMLKNGTDIRTLQKLMGHASVQILMRYLNLANSEAIEVHHVNSPADRHYANKIGTASGKRTPLKRRPLGTAESVEA